MSKRILFLTQTGATLPGAFLRILPFVNLGRDRGQDVSWRFIPDGALERGAFLLGLPRCDVLVVQNRLPGGLELALLRRRCRRLVLDFDRPLWAAGDCAGPDPRNERREAALNRRLVTACRGADTVLASGEWLAAAARPLVPDVRVLPTPIDTAAYRPPAEHRAPSGDGPIVGWMGAPGELSLLDGPLRALEAHSGRLRYSVVADKRLSEPVRGAADLELWSPAGEAARLQALDIGLLPLEGPGAAAGDCAYSLLRYMACGIVPVAAATPCSREIVEHGRDGFLVERPTEWAEYVLRLAEDGALRASLSAAARDKAVKRFGVAAVFAQYERLLGL